MKISNFLILAAAALLLSLAPVVAFGEEKPAAEAKPDAEHRDEGEQLLGSMRDLARVQYAKTGAAPETLTGKGKGCGAAAGELKGEHFTVTDKVYVVGDMGGKAALTAEPVKAADGYVILVFHWASGKSEIKWYDTFDALKKAHEDVEFGDDEAEEPEDSESDAGKQWDALYKVGATWTSSFSGGTFLMKTEVTEVKDGVAKIKNAMKMGDADWMEPSESEAKRPEKTTIETKPDPNWKETGKGTDKVKVGEVEIDVDWFEGTYSGKKIRTVTSTKYGIVVKSEYDGKVTMELTEFNPK